MSDDSNDSVVDDFRLVSPIATGSTTQVWEVQEGTAGRTLAMKLLLPNVPDKAAGKATLRIEAAVGKTLDHPNVIRIEKVVISRDNSYLLMEYFRAVNVKLQIKGEPAAVQSRIVKYIEGTCQALAHMHQKGWIHRDFKPENVLMNRAGEVKLIDFSLAMHPPGALSKLMGSGPRVIQGTRMYIAPETILKKPPVIQTDMYSYGVTLFEVVTGGKMPFQATSPQELLQKHIATDCPPASFYNPNVTQEMDRVLFKLMAKKPQNRYKDFQEVQSELRRIRIFKEDVVPKALENDRITDESKIIESLGEIQVDSRADVMRQQMIKDNPELAAKVQQEIDRRKAVKAKKAAQAAASVKEKPSAASAQSVPQAMPAGMMPGMPQPGYPQGYPPAGYPQPGYPGGMPAGAGYPGMPPGAFPPGAYPPGAYPPGVLPPGYPAGMPQQMPPQPMPQGMVPPGAMPGQPVRPAPGGPPQPAPPVKNAPPAPPARVAPPAQGSAPSRVMPPAQPPRSTPPAKSPPPKSPAIRGPSPEDDDLEVMTELPDII